MLHLLSALSAWFIFRLLRLLYISTLMSLKIRRNTRALTSFDKGKKTSCAHNFFTVNYCCTHSHHVDFQQVWTIKDTTIWMIRCDLVCNITDLINVPLVRLKTYQSPCMTISLHWRSVKLEDTLYIFSQKLVTQNIEKCHEICGEQTNINHRSHKAALIACYTLYYLLTAHTHNHKGFGPLQKKQKQKKITRIKS